MKLAVTRERGCTAQSAYLLELNDRSDRGGCSLQE